MTVYTISSLTKKILRKSVRTARGLVRSFRADNDRLLFVFGGRTSHWAGMGRTLYEQEPVFRASVQETSQLVSQLGGMDILPNFEGPPDPDFFAHGTKVIFSIMAVQLALADLWKAKGILPDATLGVSLGEVTAVYAAGGLTRADVVRVCAIWHITGLAKPKEFISVYLRTNLIDAQAICHTCPVFLTAIYEAGPDSILAFCRLADKTLVDEFLDAKQVIRQWVHPDTSTPFHTPLFEPDRRQFEQSLKELTPQPLCLDYYSPTLGKRLPKHTLVPTTLWHDLICSPVLLYTTLQAVLADRYRVITHVGPHPFLTGNTQKEAFDVTSSFQLLDSMRYQTPELALFRATHRQLRRLQWKKALNRVNRQPADTDEAAGFIRHLDLSAPAVLENPHPVYAYLRGRGNLFFLPVHQAWLVLTYDDANYVVQHPALFSSKVHQDFDSFLLGADAPDHTLVRGLLQPLFSPPVLASLREYAQTVVQQRLDALVTRPQFDVVDDLSLPVVQAVVARFMGLQPAEAAALQRSLTGHLYAMGYLDDLTKFFGSYLENLPVRATNQIGSLLMAQVRAGQLPLTGAVSLMKLMWVAGTSTTSMLLSNVVNALVNHPQLAQQLQRDNALIPKFVDECLRLEPPEPMLFRLTTQAASLAGRAIAAGSLVMVSTVAASRDPQVFANPDEWDLARPTKRNFAFGGGVHHCIGAGLARLEAQVLVEAVLTRLPNLRAAGPGPPVYYPSSNLRGLARLMVSPS